jgi:hypothetical protein
MRDESYWDKIDRITKCPESRIVRVDHLSRHWTRYVLGRGSLHIVAKTICSMEVIDAHNIPCPTCHRRGIVRGMIHNR